MCESTPSTTSRSTTPTSSAKAIPRAWSISSAQGLLIATPEYQHSIPGVLKNAIDWASRPPRRSVLKRKPVAIMGATPGRFGTARAQTDLRKVLVYNECMVLSRPSVLVRSARDKFSEDLELDHAETREKVAELMTHFAAWIRHTASWEPPATD